MQEILLKSLYLQWIKMGQCLSGFSSFIRSSVTRSRGLEGDYMIRCHSMSCWILLRLGDSL